MNMTELQYTLDNSSLFELWKKATSLTSYAKTFGLCVGQDCISGVGLKINDECFDDELLRHGTRSVDPNLHITGSFSILGAQ